MIVLPVTYKKIATVTVSTATQASIQFTSIPGTYTDLLIKYSVRTDRPSVFVDNINLNINNQGANTNFSVRYVYGDGSSALSGSVVGVSGGSAPGSTVTANTFSNSEIYIANYAGSTNKSMSIDSVFDNNATSAITALVASLWSQTSAITSIEIDPENSNLVQYSTATLYGILKA